MEEVDDIIQTSLPTEEKIAKLELLLKEKQDAVKEIKKALKETVEVYETEESLREHGQKRLVE